MEEYSLNKEALLAMFLNQLRTSGETVEDCKSIDELNALADKLLKISGVIENVAKKAIDDDELSEEFIGQFLNTLYNLCTDIATRLMIKSLELNGNLDIE